MTKQQLVNVLLELSSASKAVMSESDYDKLIHKYNMTFLGEKMNSINTIELTSTISELFGFDTSLDELNSIVPVVCKTLDMKCEAMYDLNNLNRTTPSCYHITLW